MRRTGQSLSWACALILATCPAIAASGIVVDPEGKPVQGARACLLVAGAEGLCAITDTIGYYGLPDSEVPFVRITASGFLPKQVAAVEQESPIALDRAAALRVRLLDRASGEPLPKGEVYVIYPSGKKMGPFPTNAAGVRITSLDLGEVVVQATAADHLETRSEALKLQGGSELEVELRLGVSTNTP